ncbi:unknown [Clostridium sp. CAG:307]|nr:unknown [Clostridium sp. CAG:307]
MFYTNYSILKLALRKLELKYQENINLDSKKLFLYVNAIGFLRYYRLTKLKDFDYDLFEKVSHYKKDLLLLNYINICKENKYYKPNITFLYGIAVYEAIDITLKNNNLQDYNPILLDKFLNKDIPLSNKFIKKNFSNSLIMSFTELDFFKEGLVRTYSTIYTSTYIEKSLNMLNKTFKNPFFKLKQFIFNPLKDENLKFNLYSYNKKGNILLNNELNKKINIDFLKQEMLENSLKLLESVNQALYFDKQASLVEFATNNNWHDIVNYYDYIKLRHDEERQRQLFYKIKQKANIKSTRKNHE